MEEKETIVSLYKVYGKRKLKLKEVCQEIGMSYSKASKYFGGDSSYSDKFILKHKLLPVWEQFEGEQRRWNISEVAKWLCNTEHKND
jgi:AraC-like DNA-binding protein